MYSRSTSYIFQCDCSAIIALINNSNLLLENVKTQSSQCYFIARSVSRIILRKFRQCEERLYFVYQNSLNLLGHKHTINNSVTRELTIFRCKYYITARNVYKFTFTYEEVKVIVINRRNYSN